MLKSEAVQRVAAAVLGLYLELALRSIRWTVEGEAHLAPFVRDVPVVAAFWHQRLPLMPALWMRVRRQNGRRVACVLVSRHRHGRFIGAILARFGLSVVHGSSGRPGKTRGKGGAAGLRQLQGALALGGVVVMTPDGPRGPPRVAAAGVAQLAAGTGAPVLPAAAQCRPRLRLGSWDRMVLPVPFARGVLVCLPAILVAAGDAEAGLAEIAAALDAAAARADVLCGLAPGG